MIQLLSICNYDSWCFVVMGEKYSTRNYSRIFFCFNVIVKRTCFVENWKNSVWDDFAIASSQSLENFSSGYEFLDPIEISCIVQIMYIYVNLMILWWSKLRALKSTPYLSISVIVWSLQTIILLLFLKIAIPVW